MILQEVMRELGGWVKLESALVTASRPSQHGSRVRHRHGEWVTHRGILGWVFHPHWRTLENGWNDSLWSNLTLGPSSAKKRLCGLAQIIYPLNLSFLLGKIMVMVVPWHRTLALLHWDNAQKTPDLKPLSKRNCYSQWQLESIDSGTDLTWKWPRNAQN